MKQGRDNVLVGNRLDEVKAAARDENLNLMPAMIDAVKVYATEGEICGVLREEFGEYRRISSFRDVGDQEGRKMSERRIRVIVAKPALTGTTGVPRLWQGL